jgi:hypothetical protein
MIHPELRDLTGPLTHDAGVGDDRRQSAADGSAHALRQRGLR